MDKHHRHSYTGSTENSREWGVRSPPSPWPTDPGTPPSGTPPRGHSSSVSISKQSSSGLAKHVEPMYEAFICPLTKQVMQDPVSLENGQTFERSAITQWFQEQERSKKGGGGGGEGPRCPVTGELLSSASLRPSNALRSAIEEWIARTDAAHIDNARALLASSTFLDHCLTAMNDLRELCAKNKINQRRIRLAGVIPVIAEQLRGGEESRIMALSTLRTIAKDDDENKAAIGATDAIRSCFRSLSHKLFREKEQAIHLLAELSTYEPLAEKIAAVNGSILILVGLTSSTSENLVIVQKAEEILKNLEDSVENVKQMAENGRLQPLLKHLVQGSEEVRAEMTTYLADIVPSKEGKLLIAEVAGQALAQMLSSEKLAVKESALRCLSKISTLPENGKVLAEAGVLQPVVRDLFLLGSTQLPMKVKEISATVLANIVTSGIELSRLPVNLSSEAVIHNLLHMVSNTGPALQGKLLQVLVGLGSSPGIRDMVSSIQSAGAVSSLIQFLEAPQLEIRLNCVKLLSLVSPWMGQSLADWLRDTSGQPGVLIHLLESSSSISEEQAAAAGLLANLPSSDLHLTRALLKEGAHHIVLRRIKELYQGALASVGGGRYVNDFKVGLVAILSRFTYLLDDDSVMQFCREQSLAFLFAELLRLGELDSIKRDSALALRNLSSFSKSLSEVPDPGANQQSGCFPCFTPKKKKKPVANLCPVHGGVCSAKASFCLIEAGAVVLLGSNLDHRNASVAEACLTALCTLVDDESADVQGGVLLLNRASIIPAVLDIMKDHRTDELWRSSVWMVERFLGVQEVAQFLSLDPGVHSGLVEAFRHGNLNTKQVAERALKQLNKIPNFSTYAR